MAFELSRVDRIYREYGVTAKDAQGQPVEPSGVTVALLPPRTSPTAATTWATATFDGTTATVLLAGPDADPSGAVVVPGDRDLWIRVADSPEVDAERVERITVR